MAVTLEVVEDMQDAIDHIHKCVRTLHIHAVHVHKTHKHQQA